MSTSARRWALEAERYRRNGYVSPVRIIGPEAAADHRRRLEQAEAALGNLHYQAKVHTILRSPLQLATHPRALDVVEALLGPNILVWNVTYIIKEPRTPAHVSWHQDLTYWGLDGEDQVSMWLALSPASEASGCMRLVPGSHRGGPLGHRLTADEANVLFQGQTVDGVDESAAAVCPLGSGEASFHHGWTLHASLPNCSDDRRIGLNVQYLAPRMRQVKHDRDTALLVRGVDEFGHFRPDIPASEDLHPEALARHRALNRLYQETVGRTS